jgi:hypothetical protein
MNKEIGPSSKINNVFFNHLYAIIDQSTYDAMRNSAFFKNEFSNLEERTNAGESATWSGIYLTGENTYIELFNSKDKNKLREGELNIADVAIAFSVDHEEEMEEVIKLLQHLFPNGMNHGLFKRNIDHKLMPWFYYIQPTGYRSMKPLLDTWVMAYHKDYLKHKNIKYSDDNSFTRKEYNKTYNSVPFDKEKLFKDIEEITLLLDDATKKKFIEQQAVLGYHCQETGDSTVCRGPGIKIKLESSQDQLCKLVELRMSLNHKVDNIQTHNIGNSTIKLENQTALWSFL